jgi:glucokinase
MTTRCVVAGIDIGGTNTVVGLVDFHGAQISELRFPTQAHERADEFLPRLVNAIREICSGLPPGNPLAGIGIAAPAANSRRGTVENPANLNWGTVNLVEMIQEHLDVPVVVTKDSNAAVVGEMRYGVARGMRNFIMITLGTGLGAAIVVDGELHEGEHRTAGEFGHFTVDPSGRECGCGRRGCAETYVSASGLRRTVFDLLASRTDTGELRTIAFNDLTAERIFRLAQGGDPIARAAFELTGIYLGRMLTNIVAALDPEAIVLYGGLVNAGDLLIGPARRSFEEHVLPLYSGKVKILTSDLNNGRAAVVGAAALVCDLLQNESTHVLQDQITS